MTETMIERGAAAMRDKRRELIAQPLDRIWPDLMRVALESIRNPTGSMVAAGNKHMDSHAGSGAVWRAMVDDAVNEETGK